MADLCCGRLLPGGFGQQCSPCLPVVTLGGVLQLGTTPLFLPQGGWSPRVVDVFSLPVRGRLKTALSVTALAFVPAGATVQVVGQLVMWGSCVVGLDPVVYFPAQLQQPRDAGSSKVVRCSECSSELALARKSLSTMWCVPVRCPTVQWLH